LVSALGAALVAMVARICADSPKFADRRVLAEQLADDADRLRAELLGGGVRDETAFDAVVAAQALPRSDDVQKRTRAEALELALSNAAQAPLDAAACSLGVLRLADRALLLPNRNLVSDVGCAAEFASAGLTSSAYNVRANHLFMKNPATIAAQAQALTGLKSEAAALLESIRRTVADQLQQ
jgi:formiminotetrahydrofolate cyclodeaminase